VIPLTDPLLRFHKQHETEKPVESESDTCVLVSVVMPCLNEARTLAACIGQAHAGCQSALASRKLSDDTPGSATQKSYEIVIANNGSTDGSQEIATAYAAKVKSSERKGYGAALLGGIAAARGKYVVMGDSDCSYDFGDVPRFLDKLEEGYDPVMGNRFAGEIMPGAMPWHHRYIGNPVLSWLGRMLYGTHVRDWHCGFRAFDREKINALNLRSTRMEFASELVLRASQSELPCTEIPVKLHIDGRDRRPHLRSFSDGLRHVRTLFAGLHGRRRSSVVKDGAEWRAITLLLLLSAFEFIAGTGDKPTDEINGRLSPPTVHLQAERENPGISSGVLTLSNHFDGEIVNFEVHVGCRCTVLDEVPTSIKVGDEAEVKVRLEDVTPGGQLTVVDYELRLDPVIKPTFYSLCKCYHLSRFRNFTNVVPLAHFIAFKKLGIHFV